MRAAFDVTLRDRSADTCMVALQGPSARAILQPLCPETDLGSVKYHRVVECAVAGAPDHPLHHRLHRGAGLRDAPAADGLRAALGRPPGSGRAAAADPLRAWPRGIRCAPRRAFPSMETRSTRDTDPAQRRARPRGGEPGGPRLHRQKGAGRPRAVPRRARLLVGFEMQEPGVPRHGYAIARGGQDGRAG